MAESKSIDLSTEEKARIKSELEDRGWTVVPEVIPEDTCDEYITQLHQWLAQFGEHRFPDNIGSIIHKYGIAHHEVAWKVRLASSKVFETIWDTHKLLSSMDGIAIGSPPEKFNTGYLKPDKVQMGLHHDQAPPRVGLHAIQGAVYLEEALEDDWCFVVMDKSHKYYEEFFYNFKPNPRSEFRRLKKKEIEFLEGKDCRITRIPVPKGGMVLWDSRTVHAGAKVIEGRENPNRWRYIVFSCQAPAIWASPKDLQAKRDAYENLRVSRHWPCEGFSCFHTGKTSFDIQELPEVAKSDVAKRLAGVLPYDFGDGTPNAPKDKCPKWKG